MAHLTSLDRRHIVVSKSPLTGVRRESGTRNNKRNPPLGAVLSIAQNPWAMRSAKMTGSSPWPTVVDGSHECACQDLVKKSPQRRWRRLAGDLCSLFRSPVRYLPIGRHLESAGKEGKKLNNQERMSALPDSVHFVLFPGGHFGGPGLCPALHSLLHTPELIFTSKLIFSAKEKSSL
jgi:hypothetical protein